MRTPSLIATALVDLVTVSVWGDQRSTLIEKPLFGLDASFGGNCLFGMMGGFTFANDERILYLIITDFGFFERASCVEIWTHMERRYFTWHRNSAAYFG